MAYSREVYDAVYETLGKRREAAVNRAAALREKMTAAEPRIAEIEAEIGKTSAKVAEAVLGREKVSEKIAQISARNLALQDELAALLQKHGCGVRNFEPIYDCPACEDTGIADGRICDCMKTLLREEAGRQLSACSHMQLTSLDEIDLAYYPDQPDSRGGMSVRRRMEGILAFCRAYAEAFSTESENLLLRGPTGTGKTHISLALARSAAEKGFAVVYGSAQMLLHRLEKEHFGRENGDTESTLLECDLLVLDDLGCEFTGAFTVAALLNIVNARLLSHRPTIISTNLDQAQMQERYGDQLVSRLNGEYIPLLFAGRDIRQIRAKQRMQS